MLGNIGHIAIIVAFVGILISCISYLLSLKYSISNQEGWMMLGRYSFIAQFGSIALVLVLLFIAIFNHDYQYYYAWRHSSNDLPFYYVISSFWEGQEGSFLVWIFWNALIGFIVLRKAGKWEPWLFIIIGVIQLILISMILGVYLSSTFNIGISPFQLLKDVSSNPIFKIDPNFIPKDGNGLNPLLQNIWMVIHPPIIFLGFAVSLIPFAYCISGLFKKDISWIKPAQIWMLVSLAILSAGIMMGAYWAYETLNFGGYWNWDPVENAILIPWIVMVAATHGIIIYQKRGKGLLLTIGLIVSSYFLIIYSTFLTRSGILGDTSVHSFTDLGLSGQLLILMGAVIVIITVALVYSWKFMKSLRETSSENLLEFLMIIGISILLLSAFQILLPTSIPVFNKILSGLGLNSNAAPPTDPVGFYSKFQIWFAVGFCVLAFLAQVVYWKRIRGFSAYEKVFSVPLFLALLTGGALLLKVGYTDWRYIVMIFVSLLGAFVSIQIIYGFIKQNLKVSGGAFSHAGFMIMLLGIVLSAGYSRIISQNISITSPESSLPLHTVQENVLLTRNKPIPLQNYQITFSNKYIESIEGELISTAGLRNTNHEEFKIRRSGDTIEINNENTYYDLTIRDADNLYHVLPRMQNNPEMGYIASPSILSFWDKDIYIHVTNFPNPEKQEWEKTELLQLAPAQSLEKFGLSIKLLNSELSAISEDQSELLITSHFQIDDQGYQYNIDPMYGISNGRVQLYPSLSEELGVKVLVESIDPNSGVAQFRLIYSQRDWITVKAIEMPFISLLWIGKFIMVFGIGVSIVAKVKVPVLKVSRGLGVEDSGEKWKSGMVYQIINKKIK